MKKIISDKYRPAFPEDLEVLAQVLPQGISGTSDVVEAYEKSLSEYFGNPHAIAVSSGAAAITVALAAVGVRPGDEIVLTPTCPLCTVYPIMAASAVPVFVDTRQDGFGADLNDLKSVLNERTRAVIDIPMWGYPTQVDELHAMLKNAGIPLILDLAHAHGSTLNGKHLSHYGDLSCFSTHDRKPLATGEGGYILTSSAELEKNCKDFSRFGNLNGRDFGLNYKLGGLAAAIGKNRLRYLDKQLEIRRRNAARLVSRLDNPHVKEVSLIHGAETNYYFLNLRLNFENNRGFIDYLDENGVPSDIKRYGCRCLYEFPAVAEYRRSCPNGERLLSTMTTIPVHPQLTEEDMDYISNLINAYQER